MGPYLLELGIQKTFNMAIARNNGCGYGEVQTSMHFEVQKNHGDYIEKVPVKINETEVSIFVSALPSQENIPSDIICSDSLLVAIKN